MQLTSAMPRSHANYPTAKLLPLNRRQISLSPNKRHNSAFLGCSRNREYLGETADVACE